MDRLEHLAEVTWALEPVKELLRAVRFSPQVNFNPAQVQFGLAYAHAHAIAALAADDPDDGDAMVWTDETNQAALAAAASDLPTFTVPTEQPEPGGSGLIIPR